MASEDVMKVATEWVSKMRSADAEHLRPEFEAWLLQERAHRTAYEKAERQWADSGERVTLILKKCQLPPAAILNEIDEVRRRRQVRRQVRNCSIALTAVLSMCTLVALYWSAHPPSVTWVDYASSYGNPKDYRLSDGSELVLNDNSAVRVRMTPFAREVALDRGEILIRVKHDGKRPLLVRAGEAVLRAMGTEFSVRRAATGELEAIVREGRVEIDSTGVSAAPKPSEQTATVGAGQTATISGGEVRIENHDPIDIENRLAWVSGRLYLHGTLSQAVAQFNEHNVSKIVIADASIGNMNVTGLYDCHDIREFAESLRPRGVRYAVEKAAEPQNDIIALSARK
jgi:transmembrane sensor